MCCAGLRGPAPEAWQMTGYYVPRWLADRWTQFLGDAGTSEMKMQRLWERRVFQFTELPPGVQRQGVRAPCS